MTIVSYPSLDEKRSNEGNHILHFDDDLSINVNQSCLRNPDDSGRSFNVKFMADQGDSKRKRKLAVKWCSEEHSTAFTCTPDCHFDQTRNICEKAGRVIAAFSDTLDTYGWKFAIIKPLVRDCCDGMISFEPYIKNLVSFEKYVKSESCSSTVVYLLRNLCYFSYWFSKGKYILDNLKIAVDPKSKRVLMLPPALIGQKEGRYGCEDTGKLNDIVSSLYSTADLKGVRSRVRRI